MAATAPASANVMRTTAEVLIPMSDAACRSWATARNALPSIVRTCSTSMPTMRARVLKMISRSVGVTATPDNPRAGPAEHGVEQRRAAGGAGRRW